ncbi:MAG: hypothetical protein D6790_02610, partial [Caldilineae bacterium]
MDWARSWKTPVLVALVLALLAGPGIMAPRVVEAQETTPTSVSFPGNYAPGINGAEWAPDDPTVQAADEDGDGVWSLTVDLPPGDYEFKAALNGTWDENYGADGQRDGPNLPL